MEIKNRITKLIEEIHKLEEACYLNYIFRIGLLTIFTQSREDYESLRKDFETLGLESEASNGVKFELSKSFNILNEEISSIRIRKHDVHRKEFGCCDLVYEENKYDDLRKIALNKGYDVIVRKEYEMIELSTLNINCYAYIVKENLH